MVNIKFINRGRVGGYLRKISWWGKTTKVEYFINNYTRSNWCGIVTYGWNCMELLLQLFHKEKSTTPLLIRNVKLHYINCYCNVNYIQVISFKIVKKNPVKNFLYNKKPTHSLKYASAKCRSTINFQKHTHHLMLILSKQPK